MSNDNSNSNLPALQMPLFGDNHWTPLYASEKFGFSLPYIIAHNGNVYFRLRSWIDGCLGEEKSKKAIQNLRSKGILLKSTPSDIAIISEDVAGQSVDFEYVTDEIIFRVTEDMRSMKERPVIAAIKDYISKAASEHDKLKRQQNQIEPPKTTQERRYLARQQVYGHLDKADAMKMLQVRRDTKTTYKELMSAVHKAVINPQYWRFPDGEYIGLFGYTADELKNLLQTNNVRDAFTDTQLAALQFLEKAMRDKLRQMAGITTEDALLELNRMAVNIRKILDEVNPTYKTIESRNRE